MTIPAFAYKITRRSHQDGSSVVTTSFFGFFDTLVTMRFSLSLVSSAMLAGMVIAAPTQENNSEATKDAAQIATLKLGEAFQPFHWKVEGEEKPVDRTFTLDLAEPAELQITDYKLGKELVPFFFLLMRLLSNTKNAL